MKLSVVIPTLNEADLIEATIRGALDAPLLESGEDGEEPGGSAPSAGLEAEPLADVVEVVEVVVVDGGSVDRTRALAEAAGTRVIASEPGRARQLDAGVRASRGEVLLFLHADTRLPSGWARHVRDALRDPRTVGGAFRLRFDDRAPVMRFIEFGAWLRVALGGLPYGDQALFVRRAALDAIGGVPQQPILEDLDLVARLRRRGRLARLASPVVTSARRYRAGGPLRTMLRHWRVAAGWALGVDPARLLRWARR